MGWTEGYYGMDRDIMGWTEVFHSLIVLIACESSNSIGLVIIISNFP